MHGLFILNESSAAIWWLSKGDLSRDAAIVEYASLYGIDKDTAAADFQETLDSWSKSLAAPQLDSSIPVRPARPECLAAAVFEGDYVFNRVQLRVSIRDTELINDIVPRLEPLKVPSGRPSFRFDVGRESGSTVIFLNGKEVAAEENANAARAILLQEIAKLPVIEEDWLAIVHAGACGTREKCVLLAGASHSGKSTLTAALMQSGLTFLCDDSAALYRGTMRIANMPFALMLREGSWSVLQSRFPELLESPIINRRGERVRFLAPTLDDKATSVPATALFFTRFVPHAKTSIEALNPFETLLRLEESGFWVAHEEESIRRFLDWAQSLPAYKLTYSDLDEAVSQVRATAEL